MTIPIAHGANDPRVPRREAEQIVEALRKNGVDHEFRLFDDEGHQFGKPHNRLAFYAAADRFLATHLGGRHEPEPTTP
ncbi:alpha/beta hydrolase family protein [Thermomonospora umbrina]|uniref:alpha/beta hydrolase family protein n=1 Tax=Thermomonospora umbrina TaxID=111806 RepID=UPI001B8610AE|nr:prolyl oligopeptidase family serine peptidase [Thermomonospora umbrina]